MGALIFFMVAAMCGGGIVAVVFGIQVLLDLSKGKTTAWSKKVGVASIIIGSTVSSVLGAMLVIAIFNL